MANEIAYRHEQTGETLYFILRRPEDCLFWDAANTVWEALVTAQWINYTVALTETPAGSYNFQGDMPVVGGDTVVEIVVFRQLGGARVITDPLLARKTSFWDNSATTLRDMAATSVEGDISGNVDGNLGGHVIGNVIGNVNGNVVGNVNGNLVGDVGGDVIGSLLGPAPTVQGVDGDTLTSLSGQLDTVQPLAPVDLRIEGTDIVVS